MIRLFNAGYEEISEFARDQRCDKIVIEVDRTRRDVFIANQTIHNICTLFRIAILEISEAKCRDNKHTYSVHVIFEKNSEEVGDTFLQIYSMCHILET